MKYIVRLKNREEFEVSEDVGRKIKKLFLDLEVDRKTPVGVGDCAFLVGQIATVFPSRKPVVATDVVPESERDLSEKEWLVMKKNGEIGGRGHSKIGA